MFYYRKLKIIVLVLVVVSAVYLLPAKKKKPLNFPSPVYYTDENKQVKLVYKIIMENDAPVIYLGDTIRDENSYSRLLEWINTNQTYSDIKVYLRGYGGNVDGALALTNTMNQSSTKFHAVVTGDVYSAHAVIATNLYDVTAYNNSTMFLFHRPAILNDTTYEYDLTGEECNTRSGKDRGVSNKIKCMDYEQKLNYQFEQTFMRTIYPHMSIIEIVRFTYGDDVIIPWERIKADPLTLEEEFKIAI